MCIQSFIHVSTCLSISIRSISLNIFSLINMCSYTFQVIHTLMLSLTLVHAPPYLSINPESASLLIQLNGSDTWNFPGLLDVAAVAADGQAHQIWSHHKLLLEGRHQLSGALHKHNRVIFKRLILILLFLNLIAFTFQLLAKPDAQKWMEIALGLIENDCDLSYQLSIFQEQ